ncbi:WD40-repeat-containing domain protein [Amylostereum chailletii]|nr:WD40-repeat-containing domain protein [Amylostereum chailletii]
MRARHVAHSVPAFPVYSATFLSPNDLVLGGGGGASKTGIKNKLRLYRVDEILNMKLADELELEKGEDAPMSMAGHPDGATIICGINRPEEMVIKGENGNCRVFVVNDQNKLSQLHAVNTLSSKDPEDYQKVTAISPDGTLVVVAGIRELSVLTLPKLEITSTQIDKGEIYDAAFSENYLVVATTTNLLVYSLTKPDPDSKGKEKEHVGITVVLKDPKVLELPKIAGGAKGTFRVSRFHPLDEHILYTAINTIPGRGAKGSTRKGFIARWNTQTWKVETIRKVSDKGLTAFDVSNNGRWIAYGSSDCSVGLLDSYTLAPLLSILKSHEFPPTILKFNPTSRLLVSGSADNTVRLIAIPETLGDASGWGYGLTVILALFAILFAIALQLYMSGAL